MLPIYICDDNKTELNIIKEHVQDYLMMHQKDNTYQIFTFNNATDFLSQYKQSPCTGIYLLDCELDKDIKGPELAKQIRTFDPIGYIIFISAHEDYIPMALRAHINTLDFIIKDSKTYKTRLYEVLDAAFKIYKDYTNRNNDTKEFYFIKSGGNTIPVNFKDIISIEASHKPHKLILIATNMQVEFYDNLDNVLKSLDSPIFVRCNRATIINLNHVDHINKATKSIIMKNKKEFSSTPKLLKSIIFKK